MKNRGSVWVIAPVAALIAVVAYDRVMRSSFNGSDHWKRRWDEDTKALSQELRLAAQKIADESNARVHADTTVGALQAQIADLKRQLDKAQAGTPSPP